MDIMEILGNLGFDWKMALANVVNFLIIFFILAKFAFKPIQKTLKERQERIDQGLDDAKKTKSELMMAEEVYKKKIEEAKQHANLIVAKAEERSKEAISIAQNEARLQGEKIIADAKTVIEKEKEKMRTELKQEVVEVAFAVTEKILKEKFDPKKDEKLIKKLTV